MTSFIFDLLGSASHEQQYFATGFCLIVAGCVGAVLAALPGAIDLLFVVPPRSSAKERGYIHGGLSLLLSLVGVIALCVSTWLGGTLVYRNQIGVDHRYAGAGKQKQRTPDSFDRPVCNTGELAEGQMMLAEIGGRTNRGRPVQRGRVRLLRPLHAPRRPAFRRNTGRLHSPVSVARFAV